MTEQRIAAYVEQLAKLSAKTAQEVASIVDTVIDAFDKVTETLEDLAADLAEPDEPVDDEPVEKTRELTPEEMFDVLNEEYPLRFPVALKDKWLEMPGVLKSYYYNRRRYYGEPTGPVENEPVEKTLDQMYDVLQKRYFVLYPEHRREFWTNQHPDVVREAYEIVRNEG
jgi:hypothetical protein